MVRTRYVPSYRRIMAVSQEQIRKITVTGRETYSVTIPKKMMKDLGWRKGQKVVFEKSGEMIIIRDWKKQDG